MSWSRFISATEKQTKDIGLAQIYYFFFKLMLGCIEMGGNNEYSASAAAPKNSKKQNGTCHVETRLCKWDEDSL